MNNFALLWHKREDMLSAAPLTKALSMAFDAFLADKEPPAIIKSGLDEKAATCLVNNYTPLLGWRSANKPEAKPCEGACKQRRRLDWPPIVS